MSSPYVGEIRMFAGNFAPQGWRFCDGSLLAISDNNTLFSLIGTTYGGDGQQTFGLPDLIGRVPNHQGTLAGGSTYIIGQKSGTETVTLLGNQLANHTHLPASSSAGGSETPQNNFWATATGTSPYGAIPSTTVMSAASVLQTGGGQPHDNMIPYQVVNYIISLFGVYPSQN